MHAALCRRDLATPQNNQQLAAASSYLASLFGRITDGIQVVTPTTLCCHNHSVVEEVDEVEPHTSEQPTQAHTGSVLCLVQSLRVWKILGKGSSLQNKEE